MLFLIWLVSAAFAHPNAGHTSVVVVMKMARCAVCQGQLKQLGNAELGVTVVGITHNGQPEAERVTRATGVKTYSHPAGILALGLWLPEKGIAQPAVVVFDKCGDEAGRIVGRTPGADVTEGVRTLVKQANQVKFCARPST